MKVAIIPLGWGDGIDRSFHQVGYVFINNKKYSPRGKMSMDSFAVEVDDTVKVGDKVYIWKDIYNACEYIPNSKDVANVLNKICQLGIRIPRVPMKTVK
jgi:alanine racemase